MFYGVVYFIRWAEREWAITAWGSIPYFLFPHVNLWIQGVIFAKVFIGQSVLNMRKGTAENKFQVVA